MSQTPVPSYSLYGERSQPFAGAARLHCESIASRSRLHNWEIRPHRHDFFLQILYIAQGRGAARLNAREVALLGPCVLVVPSGYPHGFRFSEDVQGHVITVVQQSLPAALVAAFVEPTHFALQAGEQGVIHTLIQLLASHHASPDPWRGAAVAGAIHLVLGELARMRRTVSTGGQVSRGRRHLRRFYHLVEANFRQRRDIGFYAEQLGLTPTQLNRVCRAERDVSALEVIHRRLMAEAERDLAYTQLSIKQIALELGFQDAAYFSRFFQRHAGMSPSAFRLEAHRSLAGPLSEAQKAGLG